MIGEHDDMPYDASLLKTVIEDHGITVQALAARSGYDDKSIYRYLLGERTLPSNVLRAAFELTKDMRLPGLIFGGVVIGIVCGKCAARCAAGGDETKPTPQRVPPLPDAMAAVLVAIERAAASGKYMHEIARDGKFDASDMMAAEKFERDATEAEKHLQIAVAAIRHYRQEVAK